MMYFNVYMMCGIFHDVRALIPFTLPSQGVMKAILIALVSSKGLWAHGKVLLRKGATRALAGPAGHIGSLVFAL